MNSALVEGSVQIAQIRTLICIRWTLMTLVTLSYVEAYVKILILGSICVMTLNNRIQTQ